ncbi:glycogen synthase GlgA [Mangrovibrevibacter kandeliae]|uniref:glycogen synthase GlgA n=1 Tax=Mangrovibrevibacter kandeliae TaxID=2968473 RepID=UPI00211761F9|nr:glycogen synthase GlgA [Aurantimonas sp. CSK15Z-1]MCQ8782031.1 glycogen synthase GlgA [Aurantimonas sp. CSK15Z-1]
MTVLAVASEVYPLVKTGGLADVAGALPLALAPLGIRTVTLLPGYPKVMELVGEGEAVADLDDLFGGAARILAAAVHGLELFVLDAPHLYNRQGGPYSAGGFDHADNWARFAALSRAGALIGTGLVPGFRPDIVHAHDWQAALAPVYLAFEPARPRTVLTIHNLAFQGNFPRAIFGALGLPDGAWSIGGVEYYGSVGYLKGGIHAADRVTTVSPSYAEEILTEAGGMGLQGLLRGRGRNLVGIVNGIDTEVWDPARDRLVAQPYAADTLEARAQNKRALEAEFGLRRGDGPIMAVVSRLTWQKGLDILARILDDVVARGIRLVVVGSGDPDIERAFLAAQPRYPDRVGVKIGYDEAASHRVQAGADAVIIPSRFEPCGLTQLYGLRYGCIPIVSKVGGLADTIIDANFAAMSTGAATGFIFSPVEEGAMLDAIERARRAHEDAEGWQALQRQAMRAKVDWRESARRYAELYQAVTREQ